jgi:hypothetical protein
MKMKRVMVALFALLQVAVSTQPLPAAPLGPPLPAGASDQVLFSGQDLLTAGVIIREAAGGLETSARFECDSSICIPGAAVALTEPGQPNVVSDLLTVSGEGAAASAVAPQQLVQLLAISFRSDSEGGPPLIPPAGAVFVPETGDLQDMSAFILQPAAIALGFRFLVQSDVETVAVPESPSAALFVIGALTVWAARRRRS